MSELIRTDNMDATQQQYFQDIRAMSRSLLGTVNDLLDFSKIEAEKMELNPNHFSLYALFDNLSSMNEFLCMGKHIAFHARRAPDVPDVLFADELRVRQILSNLLSNAVKYTKSGSITFTVEKGVAGQVQHLIATVQDTGIGIRADNIPYLFDAFSQFDTEKNRGIQGTGLGLPIVKRLLDLMGGTISVESVYGQGSLFRAVIPYAPGEADKIITEKDGAPFVLANKDNPPRLLVVDDLEVNLAVAQGFLGTHDMAADTASSGAKAIEKVQTVEQRYDLIFMDHMMPDMDGVEATKKIQEAGCTTPIVALTANAVAGMRDFFLSNGMADFISKPISALELNRVLLRFIPSEKIIKGAKPEKPPLVPPRPASDPRLAPFAALSGLNLDEGLRNSGNNVALYLKNLHSLFKAVRRESMTLQDELETENWTHFGIRSHGLKSIFATIGHKNLSEQGKLFEFAVKEGNFAVCKAKGPAFIEEINAFEQELGKIMGNHEQDEPPEQPEQPEQEEPCSSADASCLSVLRDLIDACERGKSRLIKQCLEKAQKALPHESALAQAAACIDNFDFDEAAAILNEYIKKRGDSV
jgi:CheY-like chemotaxis protein